jgi:hypothetical protein
MGASQSIPSSQSIPTSAVPPQCAIPGGRVNFKDPNVVTLNIYDLNTDWLRANQLLSDVIGIGGVFHVGVEVYNREYVYGSEGISIQKPKTHDFHVYRQSVVMGRTTLSLSEITEVIEIMMLGRWRGEEYDMISNNCCAFSRSLCKLLVNQQIPKWVDRLAQIADGFESLMEVQILSSDNGHGVYSV